MSPLQRGAIVLPILITLCSCDNATVARSGMASPLRYDETRVPIMMGGESFDIPANCLDSPIETQGQSSRRDIVWDVLLLASLPNFKCRTKSDKTRFQMTGPDAPHISILVSALGNGKNIDNVIRNELAMASRGGVISTDINRSTNDEVHEVVNKRQFGKGLSNFGPADLFYTSKTSGFTLCDRPRAGSNHFVPQCSQTIPYGNLVIDLSFSQGWSDIRKSNVANVYEFISKFKPTSQKEARDART